MPQKMQKLSVELPVRIVTRLKWFGARFGLTGSEAISFFVRLGMDAYEVADTLSYLSYLSRKTSKEKKGGN